MKSTLLVVLALLSQLGTGPAQAADPLAAQWAADWSAKNLDAVMALYAPDPVFLPTVGPRWEGTAAIRKNFAGLLAAYDPHIALHSIKTEMSGDLGYDSGTYEESITSMKTGKGISSRGSYLFLFHRQKSGGGWKIAEQVWTSFDQPPRL